jgi:hypothetical protein
MPWVHETDTEEPGCFLGRTVPRLSPSEVTQRYLHAIAGYSSGTCSQPGETSEPRRSAMVAPFLCNQVKPLSFQTVVEAVRRLLNRPLHGSVEIKGI